MAKKRTPDPSQPPDDPLVVLTRGYIEDRMLRTGAVVEMLVYPAGTRIPLSEARARNIDDWAPVPEDAPSSDEYISGAPLSVRGHNLRGD